MKVVTLLTLGAMTFACGGGDKKTTGAATAGTIGVGGGGAASSSGGSGSSGKAVMDDFERATLGSKWEIAYPTGGDAAQVRILGNSDLGMGAGNQGFFLVDWIGNTFSADQYCEAVISPEVTTSPDWAHQPYVRRNAGLSPAPRYGFGYDNDPAQAQYQRWYFKYDGVASQDTRYFGLSSVRPTELPKPGDTLRVEIQGYRLRGYWNGALMIEATDTDVTKIANGRPGLAARVANGNVALAADYKVWESFSAGDL